MSAHAVAMVCRSQSGGCFLAHLRAIHQDGLACGMQTVLQYSLVASCKDATARLPHIHSANLLLTALNHCPFAEFDWTIGDVRPRYLRYKLITSSKQEGTMRFTSREWSGLPDGQYLFSIDTGTLAVGAGDSSSYCVSQRIHIVSESVVRLIGRAHGSPLSPVADQVVLSRAAQMMSRVNDRKRAAGGSESDSADVDHEYFFPVPLLECVIPCLPA